MIQRVPTEDRLACKWLNRGRWIIKRQIGEAMEGATQLDTQTSIGVLSPGERKAEITERSALCRSEHRVQESGLFVGAKVGQFGEDARRIELQQ